MQLKNGRKSAKQRRYRCHTVLISLAMVLSVLTAYGIWMPKAQAVTPQNGMLSESEALAKADSITEVTDPEHLITFGNPGGDEPDEPDESGER